MSAGHMAGGRSGSKKATEEVTVTAQQTAQQTAVLRVNREVDVPRTCFRKRVSRLFFMD